MRGSSLETKVFQEKRRRKAIYIKLFLVLAPVVICLAMPRIPFEPLKRIVLALLLYITFAVSTTRSMSRALADDEFWVALTRKHGRLMALVAGCFLLMHATIDFLMWGFEEPPDIAYALWFDARLPMGAILFTSAVILGVMAGRAYTIAREPTVDLSLAEHLPVWLYKHTGEPKPMWARLAIIGVLPTLITLIIVIEGFLSQGLFYAGLDHSYIDKVEWISDHEITFRLVGYFETDCVGCGFEQSIYTVDLTTGKIESKESEYLDGFPKTRLFDGSVMSPDQTRIAYVADDYDLYVKPLNGGLFATRRVYRYPGLNFFGRHYEKLIDGLLISLLVGIVLAFPYFYANRKRVEVVRGFAAMTIWNLLWFAGSMMPSGFWLFSIHSYLWLPII